MSHQCSTCDVSVSPLLLCPLREVPDVSGTDRPVVDEEVVGDLKKIAVLGDMANANLHLRFALHARGCAWKSVGRVRTRQSLKT